MGRTANSVFEVKILRPPTTLPVKLTGCRFSGTQTSIDDDIARTREIANANKGGDFDFASSEQDMANLWAARKEALWATLAVRPEGTQIWSTDVAVPLSKMAEIIG